MRKWLGDIAFVVVVAGLVAGWLYLYPRPAESPLAPLDPQRGLSTDDAHTYASEEGLALAYRLYEPAEETHHVLVFLHDSLLHSGWYAPLGCQLAAEGVAVYLPDRRGYGRSEGAKGGDAPYRTALIEDVTAMVSAAQARYPQTSIYVGGHGRGAGLAVSYLAAGRPAAGLVLLAPVVSEGQPNLRPQGWRALARAHPVEALLARSGLTHWRVWRYNWPKTMLEADSLLETAMSVSDVAQTVPEDLANAYRSVTVPLLCVQGGSDPLYLPEETAGWLEWFASRERHVETPPDAGYLTVLTEAADPIARWLDGR